MKIIGQTKDGFILDASRQELANLIGFYSGFNIAQLKVGVKIEIHHMYEQLYSLSKMEKEVNIVSDKGIVSLGQQNASEAVILGDIFMDDFIAVLNNLINLCAALGNETQIPAAGSLANILSQSGGTLDSILNRAKAGTHKSNKVKTS